MTLLLLDPAEEHDGKPQWAGERANVSGKQSFLTLENVRR